jgi:asparagine synthase (glutamine-hydrolysing)
VIAGDRLRKAMPSADPARIFTFDSLPERPDLEMTDLLVKTYLLSNGLDQCDRLSMAASVEARLPLVDYRLAEAAIGLRKLSEDWKAPPKKWLSDAAGHWVPRKVFQRRKRGFTPPWREWTAALCAEYGQDLVGGLLEREQIIAPLRTPLPPIDALGRPHALAMPLLMLEEWARGMRRLADAAPRD